MSAAMETAITALSIYPIGRLLSLERVSTQTTIWEILGAEISKLLGVECHWAEVKIFTDELTRVPAPN